MSLIGTDLIDGALVIAPECVPAALAVLGAAGAGHAEATAALSSLGFTVARPGGETGRLVVNGFRGQLDGPADAAVAALAPFVDDGTTLLWEDDNGARWRYVISGGQINEQVPETLWRNVGDRSPRTGGVLAPLTVTRDPGGFARWWEQAPNREDIIEILRSLTRSDGLSVEYDLHLLMLQVFQGTADSAGCLAVAGLGRGVTVSYLCLDADPVSDVGGVLDGVEIVLSLHAGPPVMALKVSVYTDRARRMLLPGSVEDPQEALAEILDAALDMINSDIAASDRFTFAARDVLEC